MVDLTKLLDRIDGDILTDTADTAKYLTDWTSTWTGTAIGIARPKTVQDVSEIVRWCNETNTPIVPQGGNTGLSGGAIPDTSGRSLILSMERLNKVRSFDRQANVLEVEAGLTLAGAQLAAAEHGQLFPLSLAAEGTCQIGGVLSTNAGGTHVFRYGSARMLCLGLEIVLASGDILHRTHALFKDNTGYSLKDIFVGAEGSLGIITAASLRVFPKPKGAVAMFIGMESLGDACSLYAEAREFFGPELTACEAMIASCAVQVVEHVETLRMPLRTSCPYYVLVEVSSWENEERARSRSLAWLESAFENGKIMDAVVSESLTQFNDIWGMREYISESQSTNRRVFKFDISVPLSRIREFDDVAKKTLAKQYPDVEVQPFGHLGDGNLHYNVVPKPELDLDIFLSRKDAIYKLIHDIVADFNGSISAEHGLGVLRRDEAARYKTSAEMDLLHAIKNAFDPKGIMNPGKVLK